MFSEVEAPLRRMPYHVGVACRSFDEGTAALSELFGFEFEPPHVTEALEFMTPTGPLHVIAAAAHSRKGPMRMEVCVGTLWPTTAKVELHHFGYWSSDVAGDCAALQARGWRLEVSAVDSSGVPTQFAYLSKPGFSRVELVDASRRPAYCERVEFDVPLID